MAESVKKAKTPAKPRKTAVKSTVTKAKASAEPTTIASITPSYDEIADLARKYWAERGCTDGHHEEDWFRAEQELRAKAS